MKINLTIAIDADAVTCGACAHAVSVAPDGRHGYCHVYQENNWEWRRPGCLLAERAHAEAIAQARREERARIVAWLRERAETPERLRAEFATGLLGAAANALEREP